MFRTLLTIMLLFCLSPFVVYGQATFKNSHQLLWVKGLPVAEADLGFNYNTRIPLSGEFPVLNKKFTSSNYSYVYYVLKSTQGGEKLFSIYDGGELHSFYTDVIKSNSEVKVDLAYLNKGAIVNFNFYNAHFKKSKPRGILYVETAFDKATTALYEVLLCNDCSEPSKRDKIDTYLALKYGITLANKSKYLGSNDVKLWDEQYNTAFNNHLIGLAKDSYFGLNQIASSSNEEPEVVIEKAATQETLLDKTYVLVGDNGKGKTFDAQTNRFNRQWLVQNKGDHSITMNLAIAVTPEKDTDYYLYTSLGGEIQNEITDTVQLRFKAIAIDRNTNVYWSIGRRKPFAIDLQQDTLGINHRYILTANEQGEPPFSIQVTDLKTQEKQLLISETARYILEDLPSSTYGFVVQDAQDQKAEIQGVDLDFTASNQLSLAATWTLNGRELIEIKPQIKNKDKQLGYRWYLGDKIISTSPVLRVNYPGNFTLEVTDVRGKYQRFDFNVEQKLKTTSSLDEQWLVSPNPVKAGEEFKVHYFFESPKQVDFYIYTLEGKFIQRKQLGLIEGGEYTYKLAGKTTYLLVSIINSKTSIQKLIVK
ncbi:T9SS type A sorting domain-containing protein [Myroides odoratus]|uniref:T9SS type A sorting domain-containing protein n=1 Tax=Myroides odoratus TaxID=256 RepID=UPI0039AFF445